MAFQWTKEQKQVIELKDRNILVSAAAGSGKTAVLVQRIIGKLLDPNMPMDIDRMLIVTFTNAAAAEMRERIGAAVDQALEADPENEHLQKQSTLVHYAQITTIHSFCLNLIRSYFHKIDLEPGFRIAEEGELNLLREDVMAEVLNANYEKQDPRYLRFVETFAAGKTDEILRSHILQVYEYSMSFPWPIEWLNQLHETYECGSLADMEQTSWNIALKEYLALVMEDLYARALSNKQLAQDSDGPVHCSLLAEKEEEMLRGIRKIDSYAEFSAVLDGIEFDRLPSSRKYEGSDSKLELFKEQREEIKQGIKKIKEQFYFEEPQTLLEQMKEMAPVLKELSRLVLEFTDSFSKKKREKNIVDFNDLEHFALMILLDPQTKQPTDVANECKSMFDEVMIDEYQDSNLVQETLMLAVSRESRGEWNRFMVGDVKQSIYRFRLARPDIFMEKYGRYTSEDSREQKIELHQNFRSRNEVLDFANDIFYAIMKKNLGNVEYDAAAALHPGASYPENAGIEPEVILGEATDDMMEDAGMENKLELEAGLIAARIRKLMAEQKVTDKETGELRQAKYSDIVILLRSFGSIADIYQKSLESQGIPAHATSKSGYFQAIEVQTVLSLLRILDNPFQDIPLAAVMKSPIGGFTDEDLANLRNRNKDLEFFQCVFQEAEPVTEADHELESRRAAFVQKIEEYRQLVPEKPIHELLTELLKITGYREYITAMVHGSRRKANIDMLVEKAIAYEKTSYRGLFHFIRYIDRLVRYEVDYGEAEMISENEEAVRIMTIHKSKGLEFPIVFVSGMGRNFNKQDTRSQIIIHPELGVGMDFIDPERRIKSPTLLKRVLSKMTDMENQGEELRVLYVALTRAKEKLILTGMVKNGDILLEKYKSQYSIAEDKSLSFTARATAKTYLDWILPSLFLQNRENCISLCDTRDLVLTELKQQIEKNEILEQLVRMAEHPDQAQLKVINDKLTAVYPYAKDSIQRQKYSVSELKHRAMEAVFEEEDETAQEVALPTGLVPYIPAFIESREEVNQGALRGLAMHRAMECLPLEQIVLADQKEMQLELSIKQLIRAGRLSEEEGSLLRKDKLLTFFKSSLAERMTQASQKGLLFLEKPFVMSRPAVEIDPDGGDSEVLIQGIIDAYFLEAGEVVLLDYKTDVIHSARELSDRYRRQIELYQQAVEQGSGYPVKERILYSFYLDQEIQM